MHIKPEKMLNCPKCPFVTEYKHHLEYHLRNHFGSKPFKCPNCSYTCVNKSMLNSHMKSHTNIYQYRCADCNYATKYCHRLVVYFLELKNLKYVLLIIIKNFTIFLITSSFQSKITFEKIRSQTSNGFKP